MPDFHGLCIFCAGGISRGWARNFDSGAPKLSDKVHQSSQKRRVPMWIRRVPHANKCSGKVNLSVISMRLVFGEVGAIRARRFCRVEEGKGYRRGVCS